MKGTKTFLMTIAIAFVAAGTPAAALAQSIGNLNLGDYINAAGLNLGNYIPGYNNGGYNNGGYNNGSNNNGTLRDQGVISQVNGTNIILQDGRSVFLHQGTVINPRGTSLQAGQRVYVSGSPGGNGSINANEVDVNPNGGSNNGGYNNGGYNNGGYNNGGYNNGGYNNGGYNNGGYNNTSYNNGSARDDQRARHRHDNDDKGKGNQSDRGNNQNNNGNNDNNSEKGHLQH
jgi:hypothetical protein